MGRQPLSPAPGLVTLGAVPQDIWRRVAAYAAHEDPRVAGCNTIALMVASSQPFYPLYVYWSVSPDIAPTFMTFLSTPFFVAVPAVSRRWPALGRGLLPLTGMANVLVSAKAFGAASGVAIFLLPCALIAAAYFRPSERIVALGLTAAALAIFIVIEGQAFEPVHIYSPAEYAAFVRLNALSAGALVALIGLLLSAVVQG